MVLHQAGLRLLEQVVYCLPGAVNLLIYPQFMVDECHLMAQVSAFILGYELSEGLDFMERSLS